MLAGFNRRLREFEVRVRRRHNVNDINLRSSDDRLPVGADLRNVEALGESLRALSHHIADGDNLTARIALPAGDVAVLSPSSCAQYSDS